MFDQVGSQVMEIVTKGGRFCVFKLTQDHQGMSMGLLGVPLENHQIETFSVNF